MKPSLVARRITRFATPQSAIKLRMWQERGGTLNKMLAVLPQQKILYTSVPKAANSTIKFCLWSACGFTINTTHINSFTYNHPGPSRRVSDISNRDLRSIFAADDWLRFTFVRNPYRRIVSAYQDKILGGGDKGKPNAFLRKINWRSHKPPTFAEFVAIICKQQHDAMDWHWMPQTRLIMNRLISYNFIGRVESFSKDMQFVLEHMQIPQAQIKTLLLAPKNVNVSKEIDAPIITTDLAEYIYRCYQDDFDYFGYDRNSYT